MNNPGKVTDTKSLLTFWEISTANFALSFTYTTLYTDKISSFPEKLASNNYMASDWMKQISNQSEALTRFC